MKKRILVVDDEADLTLLLRLSLEAEGYYNVREENDPNCVLGAAREFEPDLVLLDVMMPGIDGSDVAARLRADERLRHTPVVFLTALASEGEAPSGASNGGGYTYMPKTTGIAKLIECIEGKLGKSLS